jgi:serine/threonine-protein kinase
MVNKKMAKLNIKNGDKIGSGVVSSFLGEGGNAVVYKIWNEKLGVNRAVKIFKPNQSIEAAERFNSEMKILAQLSHPNIINVLQVGEYEGLGFIEMDLAEGLSLDTLISSRGTIPFKVVLAIIIETGNALHYIHNRQYKIDGETKIGLLHRDIKPANILLPLMNRVRLTDFGISTLSNRAAQSLTAQNTLLGSLQYLAPEELDNKPIDVRSDIYGFGCVMYEMIAGNKAFPQATIEELISARVKNKYNPIKTHGKKIPKEIVNLIKKSMAQNPEDRPKTALEIVEIVEYYYKKLTNDLPEKTISDYIGGLDVTKTAALKNAKNKKRPRDTSELTQAVAASILIVFLGFSAWEIVKNVNPGFAASVEEKMKTGVEIKIELQNIGEK